MRKPFPRRVRGQAAVETALVIGIVVMLAVGVFNALFDIYYYYALEVAATAGAHAAAIEGGGKEPEVGNAIRYSLQGSWVTLPFSYTVTPEHASVNEEITVVVEYQAPLRLLFWELRLPPHYKSRLSEKDWDW